MVSERFRWMPTPSKLSVYIPLTYRAEWKILQGCQLETPVLDGSHCSGVRDAHGRTLLHLGGYVGMWVYTRLCTCTDMYVGIHPSLQDPM